MPYMNEYLINEDLVESLKDIKENQSNVLIGPIKIGDNIVKTTNPDKQLTIEEWFDHVHKSLRQRDLFGLIIK